MKLIRTCGNVMDFYPNKRELYFKLKKSKNKNAKFIDVYKFNFQNMINLFKIIKYKI